MLKGISTPALKMAYFLAKVLISAVVIASVSELGKRFSMLAAILASLPLTSILAMTWLYLETQSIEKVSDLSRGIFWAVLPSLLFFIILPVLLRSGVRFGWAMGASCLVMFVAYLGYASLGRKLGLPL